MGHEISQGIAIASLCAVLGAYLYFKHVERRRRLEIIHAERLVAMEKGIPLPELPLDPAKVQPPDRRAPLLHGIVWTAFGAGGIMTLRLLSPTTEVLWSLPLPLLFLGVGLILYYALGSNRAR